jgi:Flp pilus assembly pilin Flp
MKIWSAIDHNEFITDEAGQTMAEYGVTLGLIVMGVVVALGALAVAFSNQLTGVATKIGEIV